MIRTDCHWSKLAILLSSQAEGSQQQSREPKRQIKDGEMPSEPVVSALLSPTHLAQSLFWARDFRTSSGAVSEMGLQ